MMEPGRDLDKLVAEKVMGERVVTLDTYPVKLSCRNYSTDIAAAWDVVEKLGLERIGFMKRKNVTGWDVDGFGPIWDFFNPSPGETPAHAICLAALKAVGYEFENDENTTKEKR